MSVHWKVEEVVEEARSSEGTWRPGAGAVVLRLVKSCRLLRRLRRHL